MVKLGQNKGRELKEVEIKEELDTKDVYSINYPYIVHKRVNKNDYRILYGNTIEEALKKYIEDEMFLMNRRNRKAEKKLIADKISWANSILEELKGEKK